MQFLLKWLKESHSVPKIPENSGLSLKMWCQKIPLVRVLTSHRLYFYAPSRGTKNPELGGPAPSREPARAIGHLSRRTGGMFRGEKIPGNRNGTLSGAVMLSARQETGSVGAAGTDNFRRLPVTAEDLRGRVIHPQGRLKVTFRNRQLVRQRHTLRRVGRHIDNQAAIIFILQSGVAADRVAGEAKCFRGLIGAEKTVRVIHCH